MTDITAHNVPPINAKMYLVTHPLAAQNVLMAQDVGILDIQRAIGLRLRATRDALGLTQEQLATSIGVTRTALKNWETGIRMADPIAMGRLADRYGATTDWIYRGQLSGMTHSLAIKIEPLLSKSFRAG